MKNNEYNIVNITNEKNNFSAEYTKAQNAEYSFQPENKNTLKDELNDNSTVNDKVEDNLSKKAREKEEKKEKKESEVESSKQLSSSSSSSAASSSSASSTASSTAAASSAGATGGALGGIVAAATVSVAAIGTIVGINVLGPAQEADLVTFLSSEITTNSIDCSFSMPSNMLLSYEEPVESRKQVIVSVKNSDGFDYSEPVQYEEYDESTLIFYSYVDGLTANTSYALTVQLEETSFVEQEEVVKITELAFRTFTTLSFAQKIVFNPLDVTYNSVSFSFEANLSDLGYNPDAPAMPNVFATIVDDDQFSDRLTLSNYEMIDDKRVTVFGDFSGLSPETTYTIDVYLDDETNLLGSATFTTFERTASVVFENVESGRDNVDFTFTVDKADIDYDPTGTPAVKFEVNSKDETYYDDSWAESFEEVDDNTVRGTGSFTGLTPNLDYKLSISLSTEGELVSLGETSFDTFHEFTFQKKPSADPSDTSTNITISMRTSYIGFVSQEETPDVINQLYITVAKVGSSETSRYQFNSLSKYEGDPKYVLATSLIGNLSSGTSYTLSVYYQPDNENPELLDTANFTTTGDYTGFSWGSIETTSDGAEVSFNVSSTYLDYDSDPTGTLRSLSIEVRNGADVNYVALNALNPDSGDNLIGTATISGLASGNTYSLTLVRNVDGTYQTIGESTTLELESTDPAFNGATIPTEVSFYSHQFTITLDFVDDPDNPQYDMLSIQLYNSNYDDPDKSNLGSPISLESVTTEQTITLPYTEDGGEIHYDFEFNEIGSYEILATQVEIYHADITFTDTDDPGVVNGLNSDYLIAIASADEFTLPVQLLYTDDYDKFRSFYVKLFPTDGVTSEVTAGASKEEDYQNLTFSDASSVITYIQNAGADGAEFNVKIYNYDDQSNPLWESDPNDPAYIKEADTNIVYGGSLLSTDLSQDSTSVQFSLAYVAPVQTPTNPQIKFVDTSDSSLVYSYDFNFQNYPSVNMTSPAMSTGSTINDYASLKAAFEGKTFDVVISYYDGTSQTTKTIQTGVSFTFA